MYYYPVRYQRFAPHPVLRGHVDCYWSLEGFAFEPQLIYPDGRSELLFHFGAPFNVQGVPQQRRLFAGQLQTAIQVAPQGVVGVFGIRFSPTGAWNLLRSPQFEVTGLVIDAADLGALDLDEVSGRISEAVDAERRIEIADNFLAKHLCAEVSPFDRLARSMLAGGMTNGQARAELGATERTWERLFRERVGVSPKFVERIGRFRRVLRLRRGGCTWSEAAVDCGYSDQSHLVRDFRDFTGVAPSRAGGELFS